MRKNVLRSGLVAVLLTVAVAPSAAAAAPAQPGAPARTAALALPPYATWIADVTAVTDEAQSYLTTRLPAPAPTKAAIVLDIDNTALETTYTGGLQTPATAPVLAAAKLARSRGATVFFVTARPAFIEWFTKNNLTAVGYTIGGIYSKRDFSSDQVHKTNARIAIERLGYTIVANIGNNDTDLAGGHAERTYKLPDYNGQLS